MLGKTTEDGLRSLSDKNIAIMWIRKDKAKERKITL